MRSKLPRAIDFLPHPSHMPIMSLQKAVAYNGNGWYYASTSTHPFWPCYLNSYWAQSASGATCYQGRMACVPGCLWPVEYCHILPLFKIMSLHHMWVTICGLKLPPQPILVVHALTLWVWCQLKSPSGASRKEATLSLNHDPLA